MATGSSPSPCKETIRRLALSCGFDACGFAAAVPVDDEAARRYRQWLADGKNGTMAYLENHLSLRDDPSLLLPGAKTVISLAMNYLPRRLQPADAPQFAYYAYGNDYHDVVASRLDRFIGLLNAEYACSCRRCVDTAPLRERYWAQKAGIGFVGKNNQLIIPGKGSFFFLGEVVTTLPVQPDLPCTQSCGNCRKCQDACPTGALDGGQGALDARRCISCLTIEHRGVLPEKVAERLGNRVYGCDECQKACPHNRHAVPTEIPEFAPSEEFLSLSYASMDAMTEDDWRRIFRKSAVKRAKFAGLTRNLRLLQKQRYPTGEEAADEIG